MLLNRWKTYPEKNNKMNNEKPLEALYLQRFLS